MTIKLTSRQLTTTIEQYLINCLDFDDYIGYCGIEKQPETVQEKLQAFRQVFNSEYGWNIRNCHNKAYQTIVKDYLQGLPSVLTIHFYNCDIIAQLIKWNVATENMTDYKYHELCDQWWHVLASKLNMMLSRHNLPLSDLKE